jgi:hypothetical protein
MAEQRSRVAGAALVYFGIVFAAGFATGVVRGLWLAPRLGATGAVALELPVMLAVSWWAAGACAGWYGVPRRAGPRLAMGAQAFVLLQAAELGLSIVLGRSRAQILDAYATTPGLLGLAGQVAFALIPLAAGRRAGMSA